jgi:hypothetical protein
VKTIAGIEDPAVIEKTLTHLNKLMPPRNPFRGTRAGRPREPSCLTQRKKTQHAWRRSAQAIGQLSA